MGLEIKHSEKGFRLIDTIDDKKIHSDPWVDLRGAKYLLIRRALLDFVDRAIKIDMDFPVGWTLNGEYGDKSEQKALKYMMDNGCTSEFYQSEFQKLFEQYDLLNIINQTHDNK